MAENSVGVGISYVKDENGKLIKKRTPAVRKTPADGIDDDVYVLDENGELVPWSPPPPRPFTQEDQERIYRTRDRRHTRAWYNKTLEAVIEGRLIMTKEQYHALTVLGRSKGWNRHPSAKR